MRCDAVRWIGSAGAHCGPCARRLDRGAHCHAFSSSSSSFPPPSCLSSLAVHLYPISSVLNCLHVGRIPNMPVYKFNFHCLCSSACLVWTR
ncbi:unnamed protein product [Musa acuminata subsp. burmannicoides]